MDTEVFIGIKATKLRQADAQRRKTRSLFSVLAMSLRIYTLVTRWFFDATSSTQQLACINVT